MKRLTKQNKIDINGSAIYKVIHQNYSPENAVYKALKFYRPDTIIEENDDKIVLIPRKTYNELINSVKKYIECYNQITKH